MNDHDENDLYVTSETLERFVKRVERINRNPQCIKPITFELFPELLENHDGDLEEVYKVVFNDFSDNYYVGDWQLVSYTEDNVVYSFPTIETTAPIDFVKDLISTEYPRCDHCNTNHARRRSYIIHNIVTDEWMAVGSTCLQDFLPTRSPINLLSTIDDLFYDFYEEFDNRMRVTSFYDLKRVLAHVAHHVKYSGNGYVTSRTAQDSFGEKASTATEIRLLLTAQKYGEAMIDAYGRDNMYISEDHYELADEIVAGLRQHYEENVPETEFDINTNTILERGACSLREFGLACYMFVTWTGHENEVDVPILKERYPSDSDGKIEVTFTAVRSERNFVPYDNRYGTNFRVFGYIEDSIGRYNANLWLGNGRKNFYEEFTALETYEPVEIKCNVVWNGKYETNELKNLKFYL